MIKEKLFDFPFVFDKVRRILTGGNHLIKQKICEYVEAPVLDVGCGTGELVGIKKDYTGVDLNPKFIEKARERFPERYFYVMDAMHLNFKDNSFKTVLIMNFLHHFDDADCYKILREAKRVSSENVVILDSYTDYSFGKLRSFLDRGDYMRTKDNHLRVVRKLFKVEDTSTFKSGIYPFIILRCK